MGNLKDKMESVIVSKDVVSAMNSLMNTAYEERIINIKFNYDEDLITIIKIARLAVSQVNEHSIRCDNVYHSFETELDANQMAKTDPIKEHMKQAIGWIMAQREEILTAFIAKYKCQPDEVVQVTHITDRGIEWKVMKTQTLEGKG